jgi:hypothetical protein
MRLPESQIKQAILHPVDEVREQALHYFSEVRSLDPTVMPLVIEAVEKHGREKAFSILRTAERLAQTEATVEWLIAELRREYDLANIEQDNHRFAVAIILSEADPQLIAPREKEILSLKNFPVRLREPLHDRIDMASWPWERAYEALMNFGLDTMRRRRITQNDVRYGNRLVEALARHPDQAGAVFDLLKRPYPGKDRSFVLWLEPWIMAVAGEMKIEAAIPFFMKQTKSEHERIIDEALMALGRLGTDAVVRAIDQAWWGADQETRCSYAILLEEIHGDESVKWCRAFLGGEEDREVQILLANSLLGNFETDAIDLCWPMVADMDEEDMAPDERDLRYRLVAIAMIMGKTFPHFEEWHKAALRDNWGWFKREHKRLADTFMADSPGPKISPN